jgi:hypothetical protein
MWLFFLVATTCFPAAAAQADPTPSPAARATGQRLAEMFVAGYGRGNNPLKEARRLYDSARDGAKTDPRVDYAYGLVLLKQLRNKEALAQFEAVTKSGPEYWPGWQALIWSHFIAKDYSSGYLKLRELGRRLAESKSNLTERRLSAEWMGEVIAALQKSVDSVKQRETLIREDEALREILGVELQASFASGKTTVHSLHSLLEEDVQQTRELELAKQEKERAEKEVEVAKNLEASAEKRESLKKSAEDWKKYLDEQLAAFDKQLARLEKDYDFMQKRVVSLTASQVQVNAEIALVGQQASNTKPGQFADALQQRRAALELQLLKYQVDLDQSMGSALMIAQRAQAVAGQRAAAVQQYEKATGQLVQRDANLDKFQDRLKKEGEKLKAPPKSKPAPLTNKVKQVRSFRTYVDLDLVLERDRVLDSFGIATAQPSETK